VALLESTEGSALLVSALGLPLVGATESVSRVLIEGIGGTLSELDTRSVSRPLEGPYQPFHDLLGTGPDSFLATAVDLSAFPAETRILACQITGASVSASATDNPLPPKKQAGKWKLHLNRDSGHGQTFQPYGSGGPDSRPILSAGPGPGDRFGVAIALPSNDAAEWQAAVGAYGSTASYQGQVTAGHGAVWLTHEEDGEAKLLRKISSADSLRLKGMDWFGYALASQDLDGDGVPDLLVGAPQDDEVATNAGALWAVLLDRTGTVVRAKKILPTAEVVGENPMDQAWFGAAVAVSGADHNSGCTDIAVSAPRDGRFAQSGGAVYSLRLSPDLTVVEPASVLSPGSNIHEESFFGASLAVAPDGSALLVGAPGHSQGACGAVWLFERTPMGWSARQGPLEPQRFGIAQSGGSLGLGRSLAIFEEPGTSRLLMAVGCNGLDDYRGGVWVGTLESVKTGGHPGFKRVAPPTQLEPFDHFGTALAGRNGRLLIGAPGRGADGSSLGSVMQVLVP